MNRIVMGTLFIVLLLVSAMCAFAPMITSYNPEDINLLAIDEAPSKSHILGCDALGRDVFTRLLYGGRISIVIAVVVALIQLIIGVGLGMMAGYFGTWIDIGLIKGAELIQCFPFFILAMTLVSVIGPGFKSVVLILGIIGWPSIFFIMRAETLKLREAEFVIASKSLGASHFRLLHKHILPHIKQLMLVQITFSVASAILSESSLSFLGMGIMPPHSSWGNMLAAARTMSILKNNWWQWLPAGMSIFIMVLSVMVLGRKLNQVRL